MTVGPMMTCVSFGVHRGERYYSVKEVAKEVLGGKSDRFVRDLIDEGQLEAVNVAVDPNGRRDLLIAETAIDNFLRQRKLAVVPSRSIPALKPSRKRVKLENDRGFISTIQAHLEGRRR